MHCAGPTLIPLRESQETRQRRQRYSKIDLRTLDLLPGDPASDDFAVVCSGIIGLLTQQTEPDARQRRR